MTQFKELLGNDLGEYFEDYWIFMLIGLLGYIMLSQIGIWNIISKIIQQIILMSLMGLSIYFWWILVRGNYDTLNKNGFLNGSQGISDIIKVFNGDIINNQLLTIITDITLITGTTLIFIGYLYRQLPLQLIPNCIPCIGYYDDYIACLLIVFGFILTVISTYYQYYYTNESNSTKEFIKIAKKLNNNTQNFINNNNKQKWYDLINIIEIYTKHLITSLTIMYQHGLTIINNFIQTKSTNKTEF